MIEIMKHLVIAVSPDSSLELLGAFADIIVLDKGPVPNNITHYDTLYIRSHFAQAATLPQVFRTEIDDIVKQAKHVNPEIKFIDDADTVEKILASEDKWQQYKNFGEFMPKTQLLSEMSGTTGFKRPVFKHRFSSHGNGVTWSMEEVTAPTNNWLMQETLNINEELRVYVIRGEVYPICAIRQSKASENSTQAIDSRKLTQEEIEFSQKIASQAPSMDILGLDVARTSSGQLYLMEVNRSPGFGMFAKLTGINLASLLYSQKF